MIKVKGNHPLAEIIAKKLFGIKLVPHTEAGRMISRACKEAVAYHKQAIVEAQITVLKRHRNNRYGMLGEDMLNRDIEELEAQLRGGG